MSHLLSELPPVILEEEKPREAQRAGPVGMVSPSASANARTDIPTEVMIVGGTELVRAGIVDVLKTIYDPEIPVNIFELGLIYNIVVDEQGAVQIRMTLTSPACPVAGTLPPEVEQKVKTVDGVTEAKVEIVWEPTWSPAKMSEDAKLLLNLPY